MVVKRRVVKEKKEVVSKLKEEKEKVKYDNNKINDLIFQFKSYDPYTGNTNINIKFMTATKQRQIEKLIETQDLARTPLYKTNLEPHTYKMLCRWFADRDEIIKKYGKPLSVENKEAFDFRLRCMFLPCQRVVLGLPSDFGSVDDQTVLVPPTLQMMANGIDRRVFLEGIRQMEEVFTRQGVIFKNKPILNVDSDF